MTLTTLEDHCLESFRHTGDCWPEVGRHAENDAWIQFALAAVLYAGGLVRELRISPLSGEVAFKADASPVTEQEHDIEGMIQAQLSRFCPDATFIGEEGGGAVQSHGISVAVDPVDGTWALLNRMSTCSVVIAAFRDRRPFMGAVANPATGEIGYAIADRPARLIQLDWMGNHLAADMPLDRAKAGSILVNVHPSREAGPLLERLMTDWQSSQVQMVRMEGGSPAAALLDAAKGAFVYVNLWEKRPSGRVVDPSGRDIDTSSHAGPFVAGVDHKAQETIVSALESILRR
jgi:fructose-1,6-bisphosphatase/inositol monophosphatase family enzyme